MKTSKASLQTTITQAAQSPRTRWLFIASLLMLLLASRHTLPLHTGERGYDATLEIIRSFGSFYLAGLFVGLARMSVNNRIHGAGIGASLGLYALIVTLLETHTALPNAAQCIVGALIAAGASALGAFAASKFTA